MEFSKTNACRSSAEIPYSARTAGDKRTCFMSRSRKIVSLRRAEYPKNRGSIPGHPLPSLSRRGIKMLSATPVKQSVAAPACRLPLPHPSATRA